MFLLRFSIFLYIFKTYVSFNTKNVTHKTFVLIVAKWWINASFETLVSVIWMRGCDTNEVINNDAERLKWRIEYDQLMSVNNSCFVFSVRIERTNKYYRFNEINWHVFHAQHSNGCISCMMSKMLDLKWKISQSTITLSPRDMHYLKSQVRSNSTFPGDWRFYK